jgi:hypothetical protein
VSGQASDLDLADLAGQQPPPAAVNDRKIMIGERPPDGAQPPPFAGNRRDPAGLALAVAVRDRNAEGRFEPPPFLDRERRRARRTKRS